ncbi:unnamed protein product, partial [Discosporangium mesarthrocarpum]
MREMKRYIDYQSCCCGTTADTCGSKVQHRQALAGRGRASNVGARVRSTKFRKNCSSSKSALPKDKPLTLMLSPQKHNPKTVTLTVQDPTGASPPLCRHRVYQEDVIPTAMALYSALPAGTLRSVD